jgi:TetR/AcrR family transcriptional regulator, transcriptional repressor for nem operon
VRYGPEHKDETRTKVLRAAAAAMRARGPDGVGVADIMRSVGLTHGGFYAHFRNKEDLVAQAVTQMFTDARKRFQRATADLPPAEALAAHIDYYVSAVHRDDPSRGCPLTTMLGDVARGEGAARAAFDAGVRGLASRLASLLPPEGETSADARAMSLLTEMAGAVALARAVSDRALSDEILRSCRASVRARAGLPAEEKGVA